MTNLLNLSVALMAGMLMTRIFSKWHLPDVTAYLVSGVLIGPFFLGRLCFGEYGFHTYEAVEQLGIVSNVAMGFIAFSIGTEFRLEELRKTGRQATIIGIFQAVLATIMVDIALFIFHMIRPDILTLPSAITLGAIASATAPAATLAVVRQYKAKGELTSLLLPIVALDDAVGLILFAISFGIAKVLITGTISIIAIIFNPLIEIACSLILGTIAGMVLTQMEKVFHSNTNRLNMTIAFVFLTVALCSLDWEVGELEIGFSPLLTCMMLGTVFCNICPLSEDLMARSDKWSAPLLAAFFVISGAELRMDIFSHPTLLLVGIVYILVRSTGKYLGARFSSQFTHCSPNVVKYLGITLLPQAGVALGMCVTAQQLGAEDGQFIRNIILFSVLVYELFGPLMTREALKAAGDIQEKPHHVVHRRRMKLEAAKPKAFLLHLEEKFERNFHR